jgi:hypothetical protein
MLIALPAAALPAVAKGPCAPAEGGVASLIQRLPEGQIDWGSGLLYARGTYAGGGLTSSAAAQEALKDAQRRLLSLLRKVTVASGRPVAGVLDARGAAGAEVANIVRGAQLVERRFYSDGGAEVAAVLSMRGGILQLLLPAEVTSIASVRQVSGAPHRPAAGYTGLVVDARGLGVRPALCPRLLGEDGSEVFGPALVSRESAVQRGLAAYAAALPQGGEARTGKRPLVVRALRASGVSRCDVVLSHGDCLKVRSTPESVEFLNHCRVLIVLD